MSHFALLTDIVLFFCKIANAPEGAQGAILDVKAAYRSNIDIWKHLGVAPIVKWVGISYLSRGLQPEQPYTYNY
jgi:hypothetical protein